MSEGQTELIQLLEEAGVENPQSAASALDIDGQVDEQLKAVFQKGVSAVRRLFGGGKKKPSGGGRPQSRPQTRPGAKDKPRPKRKRRRTTPLISPAKSKVAKGKKRDTQGRFEDRGPNARLDDMLADLGM